MYKDLTGQKIGKWHVVKKLPSNERGVLYRCQCECGTELKINASRLKKGIQSCKSCSKHPLLIGQTFGKWQVCALVGTTAHGVTYQCKCSCGTVQQITASVLLSGKSKSCKSCSRKTIRDDLTGKQFGNWFVLQKTSDRGSRTMYKCQCQCVKQTEMDIPEHQLLSGVRNMCKWCRYSKTAIKLFRGYGEISGHRWAVIKGSAKGRGLDFDITIEHAWKLFLEQKRACALSGLYLNFDDASLDRIDSSQGYTKSNIQWIHKDIQKMKWNLDEDYFVKMCAKIVKHRKDLE